MPRLRHGVAALHLAVGDPHMQLAGDVVGAEAEQPLKQIRDAPSGNHRGVRDHGRVRLAQALRVPLTGQRARSSGS